MRVCHSVVVLTYLVEERAREAVGLLRQEHDSVCAPLHHSCLAVRP